MKMASENGVPSQSDDGEGSAPSQDSDSVGISSDHTSSSSTSSPSPPSRKQSDHTPPAIQKEPKRLSNGFTDSSGTLNENAESAVSSEDAKLLQQQQDGPTGILTPLDRSPDSKEPLSGSPGGQLAPETSTSSDATSTSTSTITTTTSTTELSDQAVTGSEVVIEGGSTNKTTDQLVVTAIDREPEERVVMSSPDSRFLKYDIVIGRGSFKTVYKGLDTETGVAVAWCELQENRYNKAEQARFKEEVAILKTLQHPNILKLYDSWEARQGGVGGDKKDRKNHVLVLVTELMTSGTLKGYMRRLKAIKPKVIRSWGRQILRGLHFLHTRSQPIIHRDLKCDNIFINGTTGLVKIGDLGLATLKRSDVKTVIGTPEFMAPEMYDEHYDESVDVYAFGMCLLEMSSGEYPYMECSNPAQIYKRVTQGIMPHALDKVRDPVLRDIINGCITLDKQRRYSVKDLLDHEFFAENVKFELLEAEESESGAENHILTMRMEVPTKETPKTNKGQESIEFVYDLHKDDPAEVVKEMVKTGVLRNEDQKSAVRSLREYLDPIKLKKQHKDSSGEGATKEKDPSAKTSQPLVPTTNASLAPGLSTIAESASSSTNLGGVEEEQQPGAPPKIQRMISEEAPPTSSAVATGTTIVTGVEVGDVGGAEEGGVAPTNATTTTKVQEVVGGVWPNSGLEKSVPVTSHSGTSQLEPSNLSVAKRSDTAPTTTSVHQALTRAPSEPIPGATQSNLGASSQSNIAASDLQSVPFLPDEERKTVRTNSNESEKGQQGQTSHPPPDDKQSVVPEGSMLIQVSTASSAKSSSSYSSSRSLVPVGPVEPGTSRLDDVTASMSTIAPATALLQTHELGVVQSAEHSAESTPTHFSQGSLESTSTSTISSQEQLSAQESKGEKDKTSSDKLTAEKGTNGTLKKKGPRGKLKQIKLNFVEMTDEKVVKCALVTGTGQMVNFQFSMKYDKPLVMFQKLVTAGHLANQHEEEFVKQIKNILSGTKKYTSADSATAMPSSTSAGKENKIPTTISGVAESATEAKVGIQLEGGKPLVHQVIEPTPSSSIAVTTATFSNGSASSVTVLPTVTTTSHGLIVSTLSTVQQPSSQPSSQPPSPPSESVKMYFSDAVHSTTKAATTAHSTLEHVHEVLSDTSSSTSSSVGGVGPVAPIGVVGGGVGLTYSQAVINGSIKTGLPVSLATQSSILSADTCSILSNLQSCSDHITAAMESSDIAPPTKRKKIFEVETVNEVDSPSPDHSEISAHSSTENLYQDVKMVDTDTPVLNQTVPESEVGGGSSGLPIHNISYNPNPLESRSDSFISVRQQQRVGGVAGPAGIVDFAVGSSGNTPEPIPPSTNSVGVVYHQGTRLPPPVSALQQSSEVLYRPPLPQQPQQQPGPGLYPQIQLPPSEDMLKNRSISIGNIPPEVYWNTNYYHYNTAPQSHDVETRQPLSGDTFFPPATHTYHGPQYYSPRVRNFPVEQSHAHQVATAQTSQQAMEEPQKVFMVPNVPVHSHKHVDEPAFKTPQTRLPTEQRQQPQRSSPARALTIHDFPQAELLSQAFMQFMYSMSTVFRNPTYQPLIDTLDKQFGHHHKAEPQSAPPTITRKPVEQEEVKEEAGVARRNTDPVVVNRAEENEEFKSMMMKFDEEKRELEKRKQKAIDNYRRKREVSSGTSSLESSGHLPASRELSSDSHDTIQSPSQSRKAPVIDLRNYQEAASHSANVVALSTQESSSVAPRKKDPAADLEKKVKEELFAEWEGSPNHSSNQQAAQEEQQNYDMTLSTRNFTSPPGVRSPRHLPSVQDSSAKSVHPHQGSKLHQRGLEGSPMSPPPPSNRSPVPRSPTMPAPTFTLQTSPPPVHQPTIWGSHSLPHHAQHHHAPHQQAPHQQAPHQQAQHQQAQHQQAPHHAVQLTQQQQQQQQQVGQLNQNQQQLHDVTTVHHIHHSDSSEWTEFASAPFKVGQEASSGGSASSMMGAPPSSFSEGFPTSYSTPALSGLTNCGGVGGGVVVLGHQQQQQPPRVGTDVSEFDPIPVSTATGSMTNELQQHVQPPHKHRT